MFEPSIHSATELEQWLQAHGVNTAVWGQAGSKSVENLWNEIQRGESRLESDPPLRYVQAVRVLVRRNGKTLIEARQIFTDGRSRARNRPPSEKLMPAEEPLAAARRCLEEELASPSENITLFPQTYRREEFVAESASYPGLKSCYLFHIVEASVADLPEEDFSTEEQATGPGEPVSRHYWRWEDS